MKSSHLQLMQPKRTQGTAQVLLFPARTPEKDGCRIHYLLSVRQVAEVLHNPEIQNVPFAPRHAQGMARWRGRVLPVLSLEDSLGIEKSDSSMATRTIVVRGVATDDEDHVHESYAIFNIGASVRQLALPIECDPLPMPTWVGNPVCLGGVYQRQTDVLLALDINTIINAEVSRN